MNRLILSAAFALVLSTTYSFATPVSPADRTNGMIATSFRRDFRDAQVISTEEYANFTKLTFKMNAQVLFAFYSGSGELLAVTRNIPSSQLPVSLLMNLKKQLGNSWITELFEINSDAQHCYYVTLENADSKVTLRSNGDSWDVYSNLKK
jgi:hypothetical protein